MRSLIFLFLFFFYVSTAYGATLAEKVDKILRNNSCTAGADVSIFVKSLRTGEVLYSKDSDRLMIPASNMKVITSMAALEMLGPTFTYKTPVSFTGLRNGDVIEGDLVVTGSGDPFLVTEELFIMANDMRRRGVKRITGNLVLDDSYFDDERFPARWKTSRQRRAYEAPLGALSLNFNSFTISIYPSSNALEKPHASLSPETPYLKIVNRLGSVNSGKSFVSIDYKQGDDGREIVILRGKMRVGSKERTYYRAVKSPILYFGLTFISYLEKVGIKLDGKVIHSRTKVSSRELFVHHSRPMYEQVANMNKFSNNFMAEQIVKTIAAETSRAQGSEQKGVEKIEEFLISLGMKADRFRIYDGSGFTKENRLSTSLIVDVLEKGYRKWKGGPEFLASLAIMGRDGSVKDRLKSTNKSIRVKTGTLNSVSALSGYYPLTLDDILVFSMLFNNMPCGNGDLLNIQHRLLKEFGKINDSNSRP